MDPREKAERRGPLRVDTISQNGDTSQSDRVNTWSQDARAWISLHWRDDGNDLVFRTQPGEIKEPEDERGQQFLLCKLPPIDEITAMPPQAYDNSW